MSGPGPSRAAPTPVVPDTGALCPYLLAADGAWRAATPSRDHRCTAVAPPAVLATDKQRRLCLVAEHRDCATFIAAVAARDAAAGEIHGRGPRRAMPRTVPVVLDQGRLALALPGMPARGVGQGGLVALMAVAFGAIAVTRLTGGGPNLAPAAAGAPTTPAASAVATGRPVATAEATSAEASPGSGPTRTLVPSDVDPTPPPSGTAEPTAATAGSTYRVKSGDTLSEIAAAHGTTWQDIARLNGITDPKRIHVGQILKLP